MSFDSLIKSNTNINKNNRKKRFYELVCILKQDISSSDLEKVKKTISSSILGYRGHIEEKNIKYIGLKSLAYPIAKNTKGNYIIFGFETDNNECLNEVKRAIESLSSSSFDKIIIRHLLECVKDINFAPSDLFKSFVVTEDAAAVDVSNSSSSAATNTNTNSAPSEQAESTKE